MKDSNTKNLQKKSTRTLPQTGASKTVLFAFVILTFFLTSGCSSFSKQLVTDSPSASSRLIAVDNDLCQDTKTGQMWQVERSRTLRSLAAAQNYTETLQAGGYHDWRLPTVAELYELYIIFDLHENGNCTLQAEGTYWSDEEDLQGRVGSWELDANCDPERQFFPKKKGWVRAIRP